MQAVLTQQLLASQAVQQHAHLVLLGDPGSGKSTFLRYLAWVLALRGLEQHRHAASLPGWPAGAYNLPLILPLRALASAILAHGEYPATLTAALNNELAKIYIVRDPETLVERILYNHAALLLLDGLDEVPLENTSSHAGRAAVLRVVREFTRLYPSIRVVLSCRTRAFTDTIRAACWHTETMPSRSARSAPLCVLVQRACRHRPDRPPAAIRTGRCSRRSTRCARACAKWPARRCCSL